MRLSALLSVSILGSAIAGCSGGSSAGIPISAPSMVSDVYLVLEVSWLGDARLLAAAKSTRRRDALASIAFADSNERIAQLAWSESGKHFALLVTGSNRYPHGTRLILVDLLGFPAGATRRLIDTEEPVTSFSFEGSSFSYSTAERIIRRELP